jgi:hypothetical protein
MKIFLDMDGVLADFMRPAMYEHGIEYTMYPNVGWDVVAACNVINPGIGMTPERFWSAFERKSFWSALPKTNLCDRLIYECKLLVGLSNTCILSSCVVEGSADGKLEWIKKQLPKEMHHNYLFGRSKQFCADRYSILVDDCDANVEAFQEAGGIGILVPRPWNKLWRIRLATEYTLGRLRNEVASITKQSHLHGDSDGYGPRRGCCGGGCGSGA